MRWRSKRVSHVCALGATSDTAPQNCLAGRAAGGAGPPARRASWSCWARAGVAPVLLGNTPGNSQDHTALCSHACRPQRREPSDLAHSTRSAESGVFPGHWNRNLNRLGWKSFEAGLSVSRPMIINRPGGQAGAPAGRDAQGGRQASPAGRACGALRGPRPSSPLVPQRTPHPAPTASRGLTTPPQTSAPSSQTPSPGSCSRASPWAACCWTGVSLHEVSTRLRLLSTGELSTPAAPAPLASSESRPSPAGPAPPAPPSLTSHSAQFPASTSPESRSPTDGILRPPREGPRTPFLGPRGRPPAPRRP